MSDKKESKARYKNIPVDPITYNLVKQLADRNRRGLGAQVQVWAEAEVQAGPKVSAAPEPKYVEIETSA